MPLDSRGSLNKDSVQHQGVHIVHADDSSEIMNLEICVSMV